jgi:hypothetical protein
MIEAELNVVPDRSIVSNLEYLGGMAVWKLVPSKIIIWIRILCRWTKIISQLSKLRFS